MHAAIYKTIGGYFKLSGIVILAWACATDKESPIKKKKPARETLMACSPDGESFFCGMNDGKVSIMFQIPLVGKEIASGKSFAVNNLLPAITDMVCLIDGSVFDLHELSTWTYCKNNGVLSGELVDVTDTQISIKGLTITAWSRLRDRSRTFEFPETLTFPLRKS